MAILPRKFNPQRTSNLEARVAELEKYIVYLQDQLEHYASVTGKRMGEIEKNIDGGK